MTVIQALPCRFDSDGAARLAGALKVALLNGQDLGPRDVQVRALGVSLERLSCELCREIESWPSQNDGADTAAHEAMVQLREYLRPFSDAVARLAAAAAAVGD